MRKIQIRNTTFSKLICGSNAFYGHSHFSKARDTEYKTRFSDDYIEKLLRFCLDQGVNTIESSANERIYGIIEKIRINQKLNYIGSTRIDETSPINSHQMKLKFLLNIKADICMIHSQFADKPKNGTEIRGLKKLVDSIHEAGLLSAISTHMVTTVETCEDNNYGIDVYQFPLNADNFVYPGFAGSETLKDRINIIKGVNKPFILMKTLAAGRIPPKEGLSFALENSKENDLVNLGIGSLEEAKESIIIFNQLTA